MAEQVERLVHPYKDGRTLDGPPCSARSVAGAALTADAGVKARLVFAAVRRSSFVFAFIGAPGFEPGTSPTRTVRATRLRHAPRARSLAARRWSTARGGSLPSKAMRRAAGVIVAAALLCAGAAPAGAVVGGTPVPDGQLRYVANIAIGGAFGCTGTLIAPDWVMTAGHCGSLTGSLTAGVVPTPIGLPASSYD